MKKKILALLLIVILAVSSVVAVAACNKATERDPNTILVWAGGQWTGTDAKHLKAFFDWYNETNTLGYTIELKIMDDFESTFAAATITGKGPDLMIWDRFNTPSYAFNEVLYPLDKFIEQDGVDASAFNQTAYNEMSYRGVQYGLPLDLDMWGVYVNMDIVEAYNKANPNSPITCFWKNGNAIDWTSENPLEGVENKLDWTWDDLMDTAKKLTGFRYVSVSEGESKGQTIEVKSGFDTDDIYEFFYNYYCSTGMDFLDDKGDAAFANEYGSAVLDFFYNIYNSKTFTTGYVEQQSFTLGQLAMYTRPTYFISYLEDTTSNLTNVRFMPQPKYPGEGGVNRGMLGGFGFAIPRPSKKRQTAAWEEKVQSCWNFMKDVAYNETAMLRWAETIQTVPALLSTHDSEIITGNKILKDTVPYADTYTIRPPLPGWLSVQTSVYNDYIPRFLRDKTTGINNPTERMRILNTMQKYANDEFNQYKFEY